MRTSFFALSGLIASTFAIPAMKMSSRQLGLCSSTLDTPLCCDVDVLGVADLDCSTPPTQPTSVADFVDVCAAIGKIDMCCVLPILEQGLICQSPS